MEIMLVPPVIDRSQGILKNLDMWQTRMMDRLTIKPGDKVRRLHSSHSVFRLTLTLSRLCTPPPHSVFRLTLTLSRLCTPPHSVFRRTVFARPRHQSPGWCRSSTRAVAAASSRATSRCKHRPRSSASTSTRRRWSRDQISPRSHLRDHISEITSPRSYQHRRDAGGVGAQAGAAERAREGPAHLRAARLQPALRLCG